MRRPELSRRAITLAAFCAVAALCGCSGTQTGAGADAPSSVASPSASVAAQASSCTDVTGDGGPADLTGVTIDVSGYGVDIAWTTTQDPQAIVAATDDMLWSVQVASADGNIARQLGSGAEGGRFSSPFVFDSTTAQQTSTGDLARTEGATLSATFPVSAVADLGPGWRWSAATSFGGNDVDFCPDHSGAGLAQPSVTVGP